MFHYHINKCVKLMDNKKMWAYGSLPIKHGNVGGFPTIQFQHKLHQMILNFSFKTYNNITNILLQKYHYNMNISRLSPLEQISSTHLPDSIVPINFIRPRVNSFISK